MKESIWHGTMWKDLCEWFRREPDDLPDLEDTLYLIVKGIKNLTPEDQELFCEILNRGDDVPCHNCGTRSQENLCKKCNEEGVWIDPAGGVHGPDDDPLKKYE